MSNGIRVCHMTSVHTSNDVRIFHKMCVSLADAGYDTWLVAPGESREEKSVHVIGVGKTPTSRLERMTVMAKRVYHAALELDAQVYHFHDPELLPYGLKLKRRGKKVIYDSHEDYVTNLQEKVWIPALLRSLTAWAFQNYERHVIRRIDQLVGVTPHLCDRLRQENPQTAMICNFPSLPPTLPDLPGFEGRSIVFAGGISAQWCHEAIIRAIDPIDDVRYELCGTVSEGYLTELKALPGWSKVNYRGRISFSQVPQLLSQCNVGMTILHYSKTFSSTGTLGNTKLFEYMLAGLPVICTDFLLWKEIVQGYQCGICVDPGEVTQIEQAIRSLLDNPEEARRMGKNGRMAVIEQYNWGEEERKLIRLYQELLAQESGRG